MNNFKQQLKSTEYDFLRTNPLFGKQLQMLCLSGSNSYGTNINNSDLDIRGIALELPKDLLLLKQSRNIADNNTDTTIYQFNSFLDLLIKGQPNAIELLGLREQDYLFKTYIFEEILKNKDMFLSQHILHRIKGYAEDEYKNNPKISNDKKRNKSLMHIIRLYTFGIEIANGNIVTYRDKEQSLLLDIRNGKFTDIEFEKILRKYKERFEIETNKSIIPEDANLEEIEKIRIKINKRNICECI